MKNNDDKIMKTAQAVPEVGAYLKFIKEKVN
jgi:hypothetical protein